MEDRAPKVASGVLDVADVPRQLAELSIASEARAIDPARWIPRQVERRRLRHRRELLLQRRLGIDDVERKLQVVIDRFARDEQSHDLRRSLEDQIDPEIAHGPLDWNRGLAATRQ